MIDPDAKDYSDNYYLRLYVTDKTTGATHMYPTVIKVTKPYQGAWMVLHTQDNYAKLGAIEYLSGDMTVTNDAFYKETGRRLRGTATRLGTVLYFDGYGMGAYNSVTQFWCITSDPEESGVLLQDKKFRKYDSIARCVNPADLPDFDCSDVRVLDAVERGPICVTNGSIFHGCLYTCKMYKMIPQDGSVPGKPAVEGEIYATHGTASGWASMVYDSLGRRFLNTYAYMGNYTPLVFSDAENTARIEYVPDLENNVPDEVANPDDIGEDKEMVYMGAGYWYGATMSPMPNTRTAVYALAKSKVKDESYVYEFHPTPMWNSWKEPEKAAFTDFFTIKTPEGMTGQTPMASSASYNRLLFYAVGNKVYRLDFSVEGGSSVLIYENPDVAANAMVMKMARHYGSGSTVKEEHAHYGHTLTRSLAVGFDKPDGSGEVVILNLTLSGRIDVDGAYPSIQVHSADANGRKFGKIKDLAFI